MIVYGVKSKKLLGETMGVLAVLFVVQFYFVRELLAAELLFGLGFGALLVLGGMAYLIGSVAERSLEFARIGVRVILDCARRDLGNLEEIGGKSGDAAGIARVGIR